MKKRKTPFELKWNPGNKVVDWKKEKYEVIKANSIGVLLKTEGGRTLDLTWDIIERMEFKKA